MLQFFLPYFCSGFGRAGGWLYHAPAEFEHIASSSSSSSIHHHQLNTLTWKCWFGFSYIKLWKVVLLFSER